LRRTGVVVLGENDRVQEFCEKPAEPGSNLAVPPIYLFARSTLPRVASYLAAGGSPEAPGHFIEWLCREEPVHAHRIRGAILDIGTPESLAAARERYRH
jgi:glucose-1-phosphate thymidylyltransferase